ncbi:hypothetical protein [Streptomyces sp. Tue6028]|uniref:hypothetical protein n=1 Tax=Streptomyces sp. Tue6028 TaxID=2036037 RepID=UPI003EC0F9F2
MPASRSGSVITTRPAKAVEPPDGTRRHRLAALLAAMVPGVRTVRVSQRRPSRTWPSLYSRAYDERGRLIPLNPTQRVSAARWLIRTFPETNWDETHDLDLATGTLRTAAGTGAPSDGDH